MKDYTASGADETSTYVEIAEVAHDESGLKFEEEKEVLIDMNEGKMTKQYIDQKEKQRLLEREIDEILEHVSDRIRKHMLGEDESLHVKNAD